MKYGQVLRHRSFLWLTAGTSLTTLGDQIGWVAVLWLTMSTTHSPLQMGLVGVSYTVPNIIVGMFVGLFIDRFSALRMMILDNIVQGLLFILLPALNWMHLLPFWLLCAVLVTAGISSPLSTVGSMTLLPELISTDLLSQANALDETLWQGAYMAGPLIGGLLISTMNASIAILLDGVSFWVCGLLLLLIYCSSGSTYSKTVQRRQHPSPQILEGFRALVGLPVVLATTLIALFLNAVYGQLDVALPLLVHRELDLGGTALGTLWTANALGSMFGALFLGLVSTEGSRGILMSMMVSGMGISFLPMFWVHRFWIPVVLMFVAGLSFGSYGPFARTVVQQLTPRKLTGRIFGIRLSIMGIGVPIGSLLAGSVLQFVEPSFWIAMTGAVTVVTGVGMLTVPSLRKLK